MESARYGTRRDHVVPSINNSGHAPIADRNEQERTQREEDDLKAQQDMAWWAKLMFVATFAAVVVTGFGVWYVRHTLFETTELRVQAQRTTQAAIDTVLVTSEIGQKQIRAYLTIRKIKVEKFEVNYPVCIAAEIRNTGQTPATNVSSILALPFGFADKPERFSLAVDGKLIRQMKFPIVPGESFTTIASYSGQLIPAWFDKFKDGTGEQYFAIVISYRDVFGRKHGTICKGMLNAESLRNGEPFFQLCEKGNYST